MDNGYRYGQPETCFPVIRKETPMNEQFEKTRKYTMSKKEAQSLWDKVVVELPIGYHLSDLIPRKSELGDHIYKVYFFAVYADTGTKALFTIQCPEDWKEIKDFMHAFVNKSEEEPENMFLDRDYDPFIY